MAKWSASKPIRTTISLAYDLNNKELEQQHNNNNFIYEKKYVFFSNICFCKMNFRVKFLKKSFQLIGQFRYIKILTCVGGEGE